VERRRGRFEMADGGTLFLDEIGEIDPLLQVKILRVLEERQFERVGGSQTVSVDVRLVAATNRDLKQMVEAGTFREDLFYRLYVVNVTLPPLREREGDMVLLVRHYMQALAAENGRRVTGITPEAMDALTAYPWPGNVRELRNVIERMVVLGSGEKLTVRDLPPSLRSPAPGRAEVARPGRVLRDAQRQLIEDALRRHKGSRTGAAAELGISRRTLHRKLNEYGLRGNADD
ncbi:MAG: sigma-54-dependent Fis family transcriptional regulator, partial [Lentisphaerae bacterium]|nr:sigma-54-dependent Fis family transcriptional regulator [Lentisphaerota bacterium]